MCEQTGASLQSSTDVCRTSWCFIILQRAVRSRPWKVKLQPNPCYFDNVDYFKNCLENLKNTEVGSAAVFNCHLVGFFFFLLWVLSGHYPNLCLNCWCQKKLPVCPSESRRQCLFEQQLSTHGWQKCQEEGEAEWHGGTATMGPVAKAHPHGCLRGAESLPETGSKQGSKPQKWQRCLPRGSENIGCRLCN